MQRFISGENIFCWIVQIEWKIAFPGPKWYVRTTFIFLIMQTFKDTLSVCGKEIAIPNYIQYTVLHKESVYDCFKDINFWSAARLAEIYNGGTGVSASRRPGLWAGLHQQPPPHVLYRTSLKGFMFSQASNFTTKLNALFWIGKGLLWVTLANWLDRFCPSILTVGSWVDSLGRSTETRQVFSESPWPGKANSILTTTSWVGRSRQAFSESPKRNCVASDWVIESFSE